MTMGRALVRGPRLTLTNLRTAETKEFGLPSELEESIDVNWNEIGIPGMSHKPLQFDSVGNHSFPLEFYFSEFIDNTFAIDDAKRFLMSLCYPDYDANSVLEGAPPRVLVVWPLTVSMTCVLRGLTIKHTHFAVDDGRPLRFTASCKLTEIRDQRIGSRDVRVYGSRRPATSAAARTPTTTGDEGGGG